jgi:hypothetical protein
MPNSTLNAEELACLPALPRDEGGPVFAEPWQAQAFAMVIAKGLSNQAALDERKDAWVYAYQHTPHGIPVELKANAAKS